MLIGSALTIGLPSVLGFLVDEAEPMTRADEPNYSVNFWIVEVTPPENINQIVYNAFQPPPHLSCYPFFHMKKKLQ